LFYTVLTQPVSKNGSAETLTLTKVIARNIGQCYSTSSEGRGCGEIPWRSSSRTTPSKVWTRNLNREKWWWCYPTPSEEWRRGGILRCSKVWTRDRKWK